MFDVTQGRSLLGDEYIREINVTFEFVCSVFLKFEAMKALFNAIA